MTSPLQTHKCLNLRVITNCACVFLRLPARMPKKVAYLCYSLWRLSAAKCRLHSHYSGNYSVFYVWLAEGLQLGSWFACFLELVLSEQSICSVLLMNSQVELERVWVCETIKWLIQLDTLTIKHDWKWKLTLLWPSAAFVFTTMNIAAAISRMIKTEKDWKQEDFAMAVMYSVDNNKITVCHLVIPREVSHSLWHGEEIECEVTGRRRQSPSVKMEWRLLCIRSW